MNLDTIRWHRRDMLDAHGFSILCYYTDDRDWAAWTIDRVYGITPSHRTYQVRYRGDAIGPNFDRLRDAKRFVEREGRDALVYEEVSK